MDCVELSPENPCTYSSLSGRYYSRHKLTIVACCGQHREAFMRARVAAAIEHEALLSHLDCETVVDVGANRGQIPLVPQAPLSAARIISFEPLPKPAELFRQVFANDPFVVLHQVAIGEQSGQALIHVSAADDSSSLLPIKPLQNSLFSGTFEVDTEQVQIEPMTNLVSRDDIRQPALLKIDVQGYELNTLKGCGGLLDAFHYAYIECSFMELYEGQALADDISPLQRSNKDGP